MNRQKSIDKYGFYIKHGVRKYIFFLRTMSYRKMVRFQWAPGHIFLVSADLWVSRRSVA